MTALANSYNTAAAQHNSQECMVWEWEETEKEHKGAHLYFSGSQVMYSPIGHFYMCCGRHQGGGVGALISEPH